jgi:ankyrin repeat protein
MLSEKFKDKNASELNDVFIEACQNGNIEIVKHLLIDYNSITEDTSLLKKAHGLDKAAVYGHLDIVKCLLNELKNDSELLDYLNSALKYACMYGHLSIVDYLLTSNDLTLKPNIHADSDNALFHACSSGHLDIIKYLLESPKLKEHSSILPRCLPIAGMGGHLNVVQYFLTNDNSKIREKVYPEINETLFDACATGQLDVVKYLIKSKDLDVNANSNYNKYSTFDIALRNHRINILEYFILELNIERNTDINNSLKRASSNPSVNLVNKLFDLREIKKEVISELNSNETNNKRLKV